VPQIKSSSESSDPERKCILTGVHGTPEELLRLALGPDNEVGADFAAKLPGRGAWMTIGRSALESAISKGRFRAALARAFKVDAGTLKLDSGFSDTVARGLQQRALSRLGLEKRAGHVVSGADQVENGLRKGQVWLVIHAGDAAEDGRRKLRGGPDSPHQTVQLPCTRDELGLALGRDAVVHMAVIDSAAARRCLIDIRRWLAYGPSASASAI
jgi:uncharacterized protein